MDFHLPHEGRCGLHFDVRQRTCSLDRHFTIIYLELDMSTQKSKSFGDKYSIDVAHVTLDSRQKPKTSPPGYRADARVDRDTVR
jgi:hypothetical protein